MPNNSQVPTTKPSKHDAQSAKLIAFRQAFDEHYQSLERVLTPENVVLVMALYAYLAFQYQLDEQIKAVEPISKKSVVKKTKQVELSSITFDTMSVPNSSLQTLNEQIDQIVYLFSNKENINDTVTKLTELLDTVDNGYIRTYFMDLQKEYSITENYAQVIFSLLSRYLTSLSAKKQWGDANDISSLYQAVIGNISNLTLYDGASGLGNTSLMLSPAKLILRERQCMPALLSSLLLEIYGIDFELQVLDSLTIKEPSHQVDISICSPSYGVEIQPLWLIGVNYLQFLNILHPIPSSASDSLWVQHCLYHLHEQGKAYLILPIGWLFKGGYDLAVREALVHRNFIESVTILPMAMRQYNQTNLCLIILNKAKTTENVWLINAESFRIERKYGGGVTQKSIIELGQLIVNPQQNKLTVSASVTQITENKYDLNPTRYFKDPLEIATRELTKELKALADCQQQYEVAKTNLNNLLSLLPDDSSLNQKQL